MGMKKLKVAFGLLTESIVITAICLCLGLGTGSAVSQPIADSMLQNQIEIAEQNGGANMNTGSMTIDDIINPAKPLSPCYLFFSAPMRSVSLARTAPPSALCTETRLPAPASSRARRSASGASASVP